MFKLIAALFFSIATAQPVQRDVEGAAFRDFSGGYVDNVDGLNLQPNQSPNSLNVVIDNPAGSLSPRKGFLQCGRTPSGNIATNLFQYYKSDGTRNLIVTDNSTIWTTRDCVTYTTIKDGLTSTAQPSFATVRDKVWMVNGSTHVFVWNGVSISTLDARTSTPNPAPPKCRYIEFWKERVWCARTTSDPSSVAFSALEDNSGNDLDPSTGTSAWPATNAFWVDQDAGSPIYAIKAFRDGLYVFKENGIWRIIFNSDFDNSVQKTLSSVGTRFNSVVELDNLLYFVGPDGIYAFDGENSARISDPIINKFKTLNQPLVNDLYKTWTTLADFQGGTGSSTTYSDAGSVSITSGPVEVLGGTFEDGTLAPWACATSGVGKCGLGSESSIRSDPNWGGAVGVYYASATVQTSGGGGTQNIYFFTAAGSTVATFSLGSAEDIGIQGYIATTTLNTSAIAGQEVYMHFSSIGDGGDGEAHLYSPLFRIQSKVTWQGYGNRTTGGRNGWYAVDNFQTQIFFASATWTSDVYNTVSVSTWGSFEANGETNGGGLQYQVRYGTDTGAVAAMSFANITPGALIPANTSQIYIQARVILSTTPSSTISPELQDISINYSQGGVAGNSIYAAKYDNRLWISASSGTANLTNNIVFVKSKTPLNSWSIYDLKIGPMVNFNDRFYAAHSTHNAISRMDYGTNDNGAAINWYWESRDEAWGTPFNRKYLLEVTLDYRKGTGVGTYGAFSRDGGSTFTSRTVNMTGTGRASSSLNFNGGNSLDYRFRFGSSTIDDSATITGITAWARVLRTLRE